MRIRRCNVCGSDQVVGDGFYFIAERTIINHEYTELFSMYRTTLDFCKEHYNEFQIKYKAYNMESLEQPV